MSAVADNVEQIRERISRTAVRSGRQPSEIELVTVTKRQPVAALLEVLAAGITDLGENYVQEAAEKHESLAPSLINSARWHLLGHLQRNKANRAVEVFDLIQSVDSAKLAAEIGKRAQARAKTQDVLLQIHLGEEATKTGAAPAEASDIAAEIAPVPGLRLLGLMGIAPAGRDARLYFRELRDLFEKLPVENRHILSMGMTQDFETAIEEGATMIRVGTAIFGPRA